MPNLTSTLTVRLNDETSASAKLVSASLKGIAVSAADLQRATRFDALKAAQVNFREAANTFQQTQARVKALAAEFSAADAPSKQLQKSLERARKEASAAGTAFEQQSAIFRQARSAIAELGVPLAQVANEEARLKAAAQSATAALEQQANRAQSIGARIRRGFGTMAGNVAPFLGPPILHATKEATVSGARLETERMRLRAAGIPSIDIARADAEAVRLSAITPNVSRTELLERYKEARSVLLHPEEALTELPVVAKTNSALKALEAGGHVSKGSAQGLGFALKGAEVLGVAQNPKRLEGYLDAFVKAKQVMGDLITTEQIYDFATNVKGSGATLSDRFLHTTAMSLTGELRGMRAGTGVDQFVKQITGGFQGNQHAAAKEFLSLGLLNKSDVDMNKVGSVKGLRAGHHVAGYKLAMTDPDRWVNDFLIPAMKKHNITDEQEQLALVKKLFTSSRAADIVSKLITQAPSFQNHAKLMGSAYGINSLEIFKSDPMVQFDALKTSLDTFASTLTSPIMQTAARTMNSIATGIANFATKLDAFNKAHPDIARGIALSTVATGAIGGTALTYRLLSGLTSGFGLKTSAAALSVSAAELSTAALKLGAAGGIPGVGKVPPVVPVGAGGAGWLQTLLSPASWLAKAPFLSVLGGAASIATTGDIMNKTRDGRDFKAAIAGALPRSDFTLGSNGGFRPNAPGSSGFSGTAGSFKPSSSSSGLSGGGLVGAWVDQTEDARHAGETVGRAFYDGLMPEMKKTISEVNEAVARLVSILSFSATPNVTPATPGVGGMAPGSRGEASRGMFSDYGVAAP